ncbi:PQQ-binding-like beta-propeller repeat protein [Planctomicrobium piriforme]|uniref:Outer membrane protein assembly factor BamB n=1 Tax=Planctomicrobium piriforme TaxID=1576369 RepID=A0A1I3JT67_9PLAN|nr:PQQ-binding-like beta-propeller repeat protein [Planctomicrobium piriforme]SFI63384.1 outer membrane protein assembly factor BamB [Planctomicrobium piriforme]
MVDDASQSPVVNSIAPPKGPRWLWLPLFLVCAYWAVLFALASFELVMLTRFLSRMLALLVMLLVFLVWWLANRGVSLRERFAGLAALFGSWILFGFVTDKTMPHFVLLFSGLPIALTAWTVWLFVTRRSSSKIRMAGTLVVMLLSYGAFTLVRWDGLDGRQNAELSWRWSPTSEDLFREQQSKAAPQSPAAPVAAEWASQPGDWPAFRGAGRDGIVLDLPPQDWKQSPPQAVWKRRVGPGWSSVIVVDGHLVTQEQRGDQESTVCYDAATGNEVWASNEAGRFEEGLSGPGPRATPAFAEGRILAYGAQGTLTCLDSATGKLVWKREVLKETGGAIPQWGLSISPLIIDRQVIVFAGGANQQGLLAYNIENGEVLWSAPTGPATYSSPQLVTLSGERQILIHDSQSLKSLRPTDGTLLWERPNNSTAFVPMLQIPLIGDDQLLVPVAEGISLNRVNLNDGKWSVETLWETNRLKPDFNDIAVHEGFIYGLDDGILCCLDVATGARKWKKGRYGHGQLLLAPDRDLLLILGEQGNVTLVKAAPTGHEELGTLPAITGKTWNHPVVAHDMLYVRNGEELASFRLPAGTMRTVRVRD